MSLNKRKSIVLAKLPTSGLGNKMLTWSRAYAFSQENRMELYAENWTSLQWGAILRFERSSRFYNYFKKSTLLNVLYNFHLQIGRKSVNEGFEYRETDHLYVFKEIFIEKDYFSSVRNKKEEFKIDFLDQLKPKLQQKINETKAPQIAFHIRRGDFKKGSTLTGNEYFMEVFHFLKEKCGLDWEVIIFSDGTDEELKDLLSLKNVKRSSKQPDIIDLFQMSKSRIFVPSVSSTFSYWAAFLSEGIVIRHPMEWHPIFQGEKSLNKTEFIFGYSNETLMIAITQRKW